VEPNYHSDVLHLETGNNGISMLFVPQHAVLRTSQILLSQHIFHQRIAL